jgi:hypothetical protein
MEFLRNVGNQKTTTSIFTAITTFTHCCAEPAIKSACSTLCPALYGSKGATCCSCRAGNVRKWDSRTLATPYERQRQSGGDAPRINIGTKMREADQLHAPAATPSNSMGTNQPINSNARDRTSHVMTWEFLVRCSQRRALCSAYNPWIKHLQTQPYN